MRNSSFINFSRFSALFLALILLFSLTTVSAFAQEFRYDSPDEAKNLALDCLMTCGFAFEYGSGGTSSTARNLVRWTDSINIYAGGQPSSEDLKQLDDFIMDIALHSPNIPNIRRVSSASAANIVISYCPLAQMGNYVTNYVEGNWGYFYFWYDGSGSIYKAELAIASDVNTQESKNHLMKEELIGALGLSNDQLVYSDSILYGEWTTVQELSDVDWLMLNMLYDPDLPLLASHSYAYNVLSSKIRA